MAPRLGVIKEKKSNPAWLREEYIISFVVISPSLGLQVRILIDRKWPIRLDYTLTQGRLTVTCIYIRTLDCETEIRKNNMDTVSQTTYYKELTLRITLFLLPTKPQQ